MRAKETCCTCQKNGFVCFIGYRSSIFVTRDSFYFKRMACLQGYVFSVRYQRCQVTNRFITIHVSGGYLIILAIDFSKELDNCERRRAVIEKICFNADFINSEKLTENILKLCFYLILRCDVFDILVCDLRFG